MAATFNPPLDDNLYTVTRQTLRDRVLTRLGFAAQTANPPPGMAGLVNDFLQDAQTQMARAHPDLRTLRYFTWNIPADTGQKFYGLHSRGDAEGITVPDYQLDPHSIQWVGLLREDRRIVPLVRGLPANWSPDDRPEDRGEPRYYEITSSLQIWPPADRQYTLVVKGHTLNFQFTGDTDVTTIDPELVFLLALANAKAHYEQSDAGVYYTQATTYLGRLIAGLHGDRRYVPGPPPQPPPPPPPKLS